MIYFQKTVQECLVEKYYDSLKPSGYLFIGHSETLMGKTHQFKYIMPTVYVKEWGGGVGRNEVPDTVQGLLLNMAITEMYIQPELGEF